MISKVPGTTPPPPATPWHPLPLWGCRQGGSVLADGAGTLGWMLVRNWAVALPTATSASPARPHPAGSAPSKDSRGLGVPKPSENRGGR